MGNARAIQLIFGLAAIVAAASATAATRLEVTPFRVPLGCAIVQAKVIVITNPTTATIAAGTPVTYDAVQSYSGQHYGRTVTSPLLPPGASFQLGGWESSSCTAWYHRRPLLLAPQNQFRSGQ